MIADIPWEKLWHRFWWLRGFIAAPVLLALLGEILDFSQIEILRAFHAVVLQWNIIATWIGRLIGEIPFLPKISPSIVNAAIFTITFGGPTFFKPKYLNALYPTIDLLFRKLIPEGLGVSKLRDKSVLFKNYQLNFFRITMIFILFNSYIIIDSLADKLGYINNNPLFLLIMFMTILPMLIFMAFAAYVSSFLIPSFRKGIIIFITGTTLIEVMYLSRVPAVRNWVLERSCSAVEVPLQDCVEDSLDEPQGRSSVDTERRGGITAGLQQGNLTSSIEARSIIRLL